MQVFSVIKCTEASDVTLTTHLSLSYGMHLFLSVTFSQPGSLTSSTYLREDSDLVAKSRKIRVKTLRGVHLFYEQYGDVPQVWVFILTKNSIIVVCIWRGNSLNWGVTFGENSLDDLSISKLMGCPILNQIVQHLVLP